MEKSQEETNHDDTSQFDRDVNQILELVLKSLKNELEHDIYPRKGVLFNQLILHKKATVLLRQFHSVILFVRHNAENENMTIKLSPIDPNLSLPLDGTYFCDALFYLLNSTIKLAYEGTIIWIKVHTDRINNRIVIEICYYGIQIQDNDSILTLFAGIKNNEYEGVGFEGIGLFAAKRIINAHGGDISHSSSWVSNYNIPVLFAFPQMESLAVSFTYETKQLLEYECVRLSSMQNTIVNTSSFVKYPIVFEGRINHPTYCNVFRITLPLL